MVFSKALLLLYLVPDHRQPERNTTQVAQKSKLPPIEDIIEEALRNHIVDQPQTPSQFAAFKVYLELGNLYMPDVPEVLLGNAIRNKLEDIFNG